MKPENFGDYVCNASNLYGSNVQQITVIPMRLPSVPKLKILHTSNDTVIFTVKAERNATITHFNIEYTDLQANTVMHKDEIKGKKFCHGHLEK